MKTKRNNKEINTLEALPEFITTDMGFALMFGPPDEDITRPSTNYDAIVTVPRPR